MDADLFTTILAMDSYGRGYNPGIALTGNAIGNATILTDSADLGFVSGSQRIDQSAGFYAVAYSVPGDGTVISFRGTDLLNGDPSQSIGDDLTNGYTTAVGNPYSPQALLALQLYEDVAQQTYGAGLNPYAATTDISVTGHSLGGGLAVANDNQVAIKILDRAA